MSKKFIGAGQTVVLTAAFGIFYALCMADFSSPGKMLSNAVSAAALIGLALVPLAVLASRKNGSVPELLAKKTGIPGRILCLLYVVYFISAASDFLAMYSDFVSERYLREFSPVVPVIMLGIVCVYISRTGIETVCRMSTVIIFMLCVTGIAFAVNGFSDIISYDYEKIIPERLSLSSAVSGLFPVGAAAASALCVMCGGLGKNTRKAAFGGAAALLLAASAVIAAVFAVLDGYADISEYPAADAVIYSFRNMSFRPDGIFFILWTVICAAVVSLMCGCAARALGAAVPRLRESGIITAAAALICAVCAVYGADTGIIYRTPLCAAAVLGVIPIILVFIPEKRRKGA